MSSKTPPPAPEDRKRSRDEPVDEAIEPPRFSRSPENVGENITHAEVRPDSLLRTQVSATPEQKIAKEIPKGRYVETKGGEDTVVRGRLLNLLCAKLFSGGLRRDERMMEFAKTVGLCDDRPKNLIQHIKGGGGTVDELKELHDKLVRMT